jgi:hypothetical protein
MDGKRKQIFFEYGLVQAGLDAYREFLLSELYKMAWTSQESSPLVKLHGQTTTRGIL